MVGRVKTNDAARDSLVDQLEEGVAQRFTSAPAEIIALSCCDKREGGVFIIVTLRSDLRRPLPAVSRIGRTRRLRRKIRTFQHQTSRGDPGT